MLKLSGIRRKLEDAQSRFLDAADEIPREKWRKRPGPEQWNAAEIVAHLTGIERLVLSVADHLVQKSPRPFPFWKRVHWPLPFAEFRLIRLKSPVPLESELLGDKEQLLGALREIRERSFAFLLETEKRDLRAYRWKHPFLGVLNFYEWFELIAAHQIRHAKQMRDLQRTLPKVVEGSQIQ